MLNSDKEGKVIFYVLALLVIVVVLVSIGLWMLINYEQTRKVHGILSGRMRSLSVKISEYYTTHGRYPQEALISSLRSSNEDTEELWYESLMMIDPDSIRDEVEAYGISGYYGVFGRLSDPPSRQWTVVYRSTTDSCILVLPGWDGEMEIDMINIDLTDVQTYNGRDWSEFQYDPSNGLKSRGDYIVVGHKGKTIYHP